MKDLGNTIYYIFLCIMYDGGVLMRKMLKVFGILIIILSLVSCGSNSAQDGKLEVKSKDEVNFKDDININSDTRINIMDIAKKKEEEVDKILGDPVESSDEEFQYTETGQNANNCSRALYQRENLQIDIFFIEGIAGQIVITYNDKKIGEVNEDFILSSIGLKSKPYTIKNDDIIQWTDVYSLYDIWITEASSGENVSIVIITDKKFG